MKIVIVDDDCLVTEALKTILEVNEDVQVLATGADGRDAVCLYAEYKQDVLLMDIRMKNMNGLEASAEILKADTIIKIFLLLNQIRYFRHNFLSKYSLPGIHCSQCRQNACIIRLVANGYSNKEIAAEMYLGEVTVRNYLSSILDKLQLRDRTQVAVFYYKHR